MVAAAFPTSLGINPDSQQHSALLQHEENQALIESFDHLVLAHQDAVYQQAYWILEDEAAAEDAAQEAFIRAYRKIDQYNGGPFRPWILKITTNYCLDQLRRSKRRATVPLEGCLDDGEEIKDPAWLVDPDIPVEERVVQSEMQEQVKQCINRLPPKYRAAVILVDIQELDYQEAASAMGVHMGTFKSRLCRARNQLQKWLKTDQRLCFGY